MSTKPKRLPSLVRTLELHLDASVEHLEALPKDSPKRAKLERQSEAIRECLKVVAD